jgi:hypothetical protein
VVRGFPGRALSAHRSRERRGAESQAVRVREEKSRNLQMPTGEGAKLGPPHYVLRRGCGQAAMVCSPARLQSNPPTGVRDLDFVSLRPERVFCQRNQGFVTGSWGAKTTHVVTAAPSLPSAQSKKLSGRAKLRRPRRHHGHDGCLIPRLFCEKRRQGRQHFGFF